MSYKFVRVHRKGTDEYGLWYFKPRTIEDVELHWREICGAEIRLGVQERFDASQVHDDGYVLGFPSDCGWRYYIHCPYTNGGPRIYLEKETKRWRNRL